jgi:hypothetical protein
MRGNLSRYRDGILREVTTIAQPRLTVRAAPELPAPPALKSWTNPPEIRIDAKLPTSIVLLFATTSLHERGWLMPA